jgi:hypothetical protein
MIRCVGGKLTNGKPPPAPERRESQGKPVLTMAEREQDNNLDLERMKVSSEIQLRSRGQLFEFVLVAITLIGGFWLAREGKDCQGFLPSLRLGCPAGHLCLPRRDMRTKRRDPGTTHLNGVVFFGCVPKRQQMAQEPGPSLPGF